MPFSHARSVAPDRARGNPPTATPPQSDRTATSPAAWVALASRAPGQRPPMAARSRVEQATGADLSDGRGHTGDHVDAAASSLGARAFTVGRDVHVASDHYRPGTSSGDWLLAHELTHVAQQRSADGPHT